MRYYFKRRLWYRPLSLNTQSGSAATKEEGEIHRREAEDAELGKIPKASYVVTMLESLAACANFTTEVTRYELPVRHPVKTGIRARCV
jgi:hypothetical protein